MDRKKVTIRNIDLDAWDTLMSIREIEQRFCGAILSECIREYRE